MPGPEDATIIARLRTGDTTAFDALVRQEYPGLHGYLVRLTQAPELADDLLQDVFLSLWRRRGESVPVQGYRAYLYGAVRKRLLAHRRQGRREEAALTRAAVDATAEYPSTGEPLDEVERHELRAAVTQAVSALPERCREVWMLVREQGLSYSEAAEVMEVSINTVKTQMARAMAVVRIAASPFLVVLFGYFLG